MRKLIYVFLAISMLTKIVKPFSFLFPSFIKNSLNLMPNKIPSKKIKNMTSRNYEFVGPICESTDTFSIVKKYQKLNEKDFLAICDVGAYGTSLASNYNVRPFPAEILIKNSNTYIIKKRQKLTDLI